MQNFDYIRSYLQNFSKHLKWPRLLTPIVSVNNRHKSAIDTDSVSTIPTNRLLTPTNDSFHLLSAEMRRRGTNRAVQRLDWCASLAGELFTLNNADFSANMATMTQ